VALAAILLAAVLGLAGVTRELPYYYDRDERLFVWMAVRMAAFADPNPHWFGHPGSTLLYPLAALYRLDSVVFHGGPAWRVDWGLLERFRTDPTFFYRTGRVVCVAGYVLSLAALWGLGRRAFSEWTAAAAVGLTSLVRVVLTHGQVVRTDGPALLLGTIALWLGLRLLERSTWRRQLAAGAAIGLAVSSRYPMLALLAPLLIVDIARWRAAVPADRRREIALALAGLLAVPVAFAASTPFFLADASTALAGLRTEARSSHPGADGLSPIGNLAFYVLDVIPPELGWPAAVLAAIGLVHALVAGTVPARALAGYVLLLVLGVSASPLHWARWMIPIVPPLALLAASTFERLVTRVWPQGRHVALPGALALLCIPPAVRTLPVALRETRPTTRLLARAWLSEHLPAGARVAVERGSAPLLATHALLEDRLAESPDGVISDVALGDRHVEVWLVPTLASRGRPEDYVRQGVTHLVIAGDRLYPASPERFAREAAFYAELSGRSRLLASFEPSPTRDGPIVQVFALP
jgi:dolichyl-phosphate-mannose-protein mannosyltransferase